MCTVGTPMVWRGLVMGCSTVGSPRGQRLCLRGAHCYFGALQTSLGLGFSVSDTFISECFF